MNRPLSKLPIFCILFCGSLFAVEANPDLGIRQVHAHLIIHDRAAGIEAAEKLVEQYPNHLGVRKVHLRALTEAGEERRAFKAWKDLAEKFPEEANKLDVLELLAWGTIEKGATASSPIIRATSLLAAFFAQDSKGVSIVAKNLKDSNSLLRGVAVQLSGQMRDAQLQDEILKLIKNEQVWAVRLEVIRAIGSMKLREAKPLLLETLSKSTTTPEERAVAIEALVNLEDHADHAEIQRLASSDRAGLRLVACQVIAHLNRVEEKEILFHLSNDSNADVRCAALQTLGILRIESSQVLDKINDPDRTVGITAAWLLTLQNPAEGQRHLRRYLNDPHQETRLLAAGALVSTGKYGFPLLEEMFFQHDDLYVRMNLALGLIIQREHIPEASAALYQGLMTLNERWMENSQGIFSAIAPSRLKQNDLIPNYPEAVNQKIRLRLLEILAMNRYPNTQEAIHAFLRERNWGITGIAAAVLLTEGDEEAIEQVKKILEDPLPRIRLQAALVLALWGNDSAAIDVLKESYATADRPMKEKILEALGKIGNADAIPFLTDKLQESHQTLRLIAAAALLECLYG